jgi:hypothetical protein
MKKVLTTAIALGLAAGLAAPAMASDILDFHGTGRVRGMHIDNASDLDSDLDDTYQAWDQRFRLNLNAKIADNVMVGNRFTISNGMWDGNANTGGSSSFMDTSGAIQSAGKITTDHAYLKLGILGGTYIIGRQEVNWGNQFMSWGNTAERFKAVYDLGGGNKVGAFVQKNNEVTNGKTDEDYDAYSAFFVGSNGGNKYGVIGVYETDGGDADGNTINDEDGSVVDAYAVVTAGAVAIAGELTVKSGDLHGDETDIGAFVHASMGMGAMTVRGAFAYASGGFVADDDFGPTLLFGTAQENAIVDFGGSTAQEDDTTYAFLAGVEMGISDKMKLGATGAYALLSDEADVSLVELDAYMKYDLAQNTTYQIGLALGFPDTNSSGPDDMIVSLAHKVAVSW